MAALTLAQRLATYAAGLTFDKLTQEAVHETNAASSIVGDCGRGHGLGRLRHRQVVRLACRARPPGAGTPRRRRSSVEWATFVNGLLIRYLDFNDTYLSKEPAHPSDNLAAVSAVGEAAGAGGRDLITAAVPLL